MTKTERRIAALTTGQLGAFSRAQATDAGLSNRQLRSRVMSGSLEQTGPNAARRNALVAAGHVVYEFTYDHVTTDPAFAVAQTRAALAAAA